jgi:5-formyltetrahydrofolate cyclo-ligase
MNKADLRSHCKQLRSNLSEAERLVLSQSICDRLETINWSEVRALHCFESIKKLGEVDTDTFIDHIQKQYPKIQLYTSRCIDNVWKIVSWQDHTPAESLQFDAVIVPMLGFDSSLQRIGYGGGYYDKFLATQTKARKIGVCFEIGKVQYVPAESHDIPLNSVITESQIYID